MSGKPSPGVRAGQALDRIKKLRAQCEQELAAYPESIRRKFAEREQREVDKLDDDVRALLMGLLSVADGSADK